MRSWSVIWGGQSSFDQVQAESEVYNFEQHPTLILKLRFSLHVVKGDWPPWLWQTRISPRIFLKWRFNIHMVKRWLTPNWQTRISPRIFLKIQHAHGQKITDSPNWQTRISPRIFLKIQHAHGQKMINPPIDRPGSHLYFF